MSKFDRIYPFTTEFISGYMKHLNVGGKSVLTVGSSGDQAYNAFLYGANNVTLFDINQNAKAFVDKKSDILFDSKCIRDFYYAVVESSDFSYIDGEVFSCNALRLMNDYMRDEDAFKYLQKRMVVNEVEGIVGDVFKMDDTLKGRVFDVINLSNVLQYYQPKSMDKNVIRRELLELFNMFIGHLKDNGTIMLSYIYGGQELNKFISLYDILVSLEKEKYQLEGVHISDGDLALMYQKR